MTHWLTRAVLASLLILPLAGCKTNLAPPAPLVGQANQFDADSYRALTALQASLQSLKGSVAADPNLAVLKPELNQAIFDYNAAENSWQIYHSAALAGIATPAQQQTVQTSLSTVQGDVAKLNTSIGGAK